MKEKAKTLPSDVTLDFNFPIIYKFVEIKYLMIFTIFYFTYVGEIY